MAKKRNNRPPPKKPTNTPRKRTAGKDKEGGSGSVPKRRLKKPKAKRMYKTPQHRIDRWRRFARGVAQHGNAAQAYQDAGFKCKSPEVAAAAAARLLAKVRVQALVAEARAALEAKLDISEDRFVEELRRVGFFNITDVLEFGPGYVTIKPSEDLPPEVTAAISEVSKDATGNIKIKAHSKLEAIKTIGKIKGFLVDKQQHGLDLDNIKTLADFMAEIDGQGRGLPTAEEIRELKALEAQYEETKD